MLPRNKRIGDSDSEVAGQMVVAGARKAEPVVGDRTWLMPPWIASR